MLIALYGNSRSGKDTVAEILVKKHDFEQRNMANPIRTILCNINPPVELNEGNEYTLLAEAVSSLGWDQVKKIYPQTVTWMIELGQSMRDIDPSIWLNACVGRPYDDLVIADVRQPNEYDYIIEHGGEVWKIERKGTRTLGMDGLLDGRYFDHTIDNNGTIEQLEADVLSIMEKR